MLHLKVGKSQGRDYLSIVSSYWDRECKQSRTKTVESLGYLDKLKLEYEDPVSYFKEVVASRNKKILEEDSKFNVSLDRNALLSGGSGSRKNVGYAALSLIYHELSLDTFFLNRSRSWDCEYSINEIMKLLVFSRILSPTSKRGAYAQKDLYFEKMNFTLIDLYRSLSKIITLKDALQIHLHKKIKEQYNRNSELVYYDVTNYYFEIDEQDEMRKKGVSKEHRPDPIIQMGLFVDSAGIPISYSLYPGNTNDCETLIPQVVDLKKKYGIKRTIVVADKGLNTSDNVAINVVAGNGYVFSQSVRGGNKDLKRFVLDESGYKDVSDGFRLKSRLIPRQIWVTTKDGTKTKTEVDEKQVVVYSAKYAKKAKRDREAVIAKARDLISNPAKYKRATSYGAAKYVKNLVYDQKTGEIISQGKKLVFDENKLLEEEKFDGYYVVVTNECKKSDSEILSIYKGLWQIEDAFRVSKSDLKARPVYLSREDRIQAHFLTCFVALVIARLLAKRLDNEYSVARIASSLNEMSYSFVQQNIYVGNYADEITIALKEKLNLDLDRKFMTYGDIRHTIARTKRPAPRVS